MNFLATLEESIHLIRLNHMSDREVKNAFFSNYMAALIMLRLQDLKGLMMINDRAHAKLTTFTPEMSELNFWGMALFYPEHKDVRARISAAAVKVLSHESGMITHSRIQKIMLVPLTNPEVVDWAEVVDSLHLMKERYELSSPVFDRLLYAISRWDNLGDSKKKKAVNDAFTYLMQADPKSELMDRFRDLSSSTILKGIGHVAMKIVNHHRLKEDGDGGGDAGATVAQGGGTSAANIGSNQSTIGSGNMITRPECDKDTNFGQLDKFKKPKKKDFKTKGGKIVKSKAKNFKLRRFKDPKISKELGDYSHVKII
jgi:hypothetical protein